MFTKHVRTCRQCVTSVICSLRHHDAVVCGGVCVAVSFLFVALLHARCVAGCTLHYQDLNLTAVLPPNTKVKVCNRAWTDSFTEFQRVAKVTDSEKFKGLSISEEDAVVLQRLRRAFTVNGSKEISLENAELNCLAENSVVYAKIDTEAYKLEWGVYCADRINRTTGQSEKVVSAIYIGYLLGSDTKNFASFVPELTEDIGHMLLSLMDLTQIYIYVRNGTLPPQLGALPKLESLIINHFCLSGSLPPQWFPSLSSLKQLMVSPSTEAVGYVDPEGASCGLSGSIPETWFVKRSSITNLDLSGNALSGRSAPILVPTDIITQLLSFVAY